MNTENTTPTGDEIDISEFLPAIETSYADDVDPQQPQVEATQQKEVTLTSTANEGQSVNFTDRFESVEDYKQAMIDLIGENAIDPDVVAEITERELLTQKSHCDGPRISFRQRCRTLEQVCSKVQRPLTEVGNAQRMSDLYAGELIFCHETWIWYEWVKTHWKPCNHGEMVRHCMAMTNTILVEAQLVANANQKKQMLRHHCNSQTERSIKATIELAAQLDAFVVPLKKLDSDRSILVCANGTIDLKTAKLQKHDPVDLVTRIASVTYDATADCPLWIKFLDTVFDGNTDVIDYVQTLIGYAATGEVREHKMVMLYGTGANGKSTFLTVLQHVLGDYAKQAPPDLLVARRGGSGHPCDVADLVGARFIVDSEVGQFAMFDAAKLKRLTGGDKIKARHLYRSFFEFWPEFTLFIAMNDKPRLPGDDEGVWRRVDLLPFEVQIPPEQRDLGLPEKLKAEASGILRWIVEGAMKWYQHGLQTPKEVSYATEAYRAENDPVGEFLKQACRMVKGSKVLSSALYEGYVDWCEDQSIEPLNRNRFGRALTKRKIEKGKNSQGLVVYHGIEIGPPTSPQPAPDTEAGPDPSHGPSGQVSTAPELPYEVPYEGCAITRWIVDNCYYDSERSTNIDDLWRVIRRDNSGFEKNYTMQQELLDDLESAGWPVSDRLIFDQLDHIVLHDKDDRVAAGKAKTLREIYCGPVESEDGFPMDIYPSEFSNH